MKQTWRITGLLASVILLAAATHISRAAGQGLVLIEPSAASKDLRARAVTIVRVINTAEVTCRIEDGRAEGTKFLPWDELVNSPCLKQVQGHVMYAGVPPSFSPGPEIVPGLELRLVVSADGKHYNLWIGQKPQTCGPAFYSDERGVIYECKAFGCGEEK